MHQWQDMIEPADQPRRLDRTMFFDALPLSSVAKDILCKIPDDSQFEQLLDTARLRSLTVMGGYML